MQGRKLLISFIAKTQYQAFLVWNERPLLFDEGSILNRDQVSTNLESILKKFQQAAKNIAAISLQAELPTEASVPHSIVNAFKNIAAIALSSGLELE